MDNTKKQKVGNKEQGNKLVIRFKIQKNISKPKCKSRRITICKICSLKRYLIQSIIRQVFTFGSCNRTSIYDHVLLRYIHFNASDLKWKKWWRCYGAKNDLFSSHKSKSWKDDYISKKTSHSCINYIKRKSKWKFLNGNEWYTRIKKKKKWIV